jgi:molecular chaperone GrpE
MKKTEVTAQQPSEAAEAAAAAAAEPLLAVEPATVTAEQLEALKQSAAKADEHWERLLRTTADFDNYKKRAAREKQDAVKFANENLLQKLMPVLDAFDMALAATRNSDDKAVQSLQDGIGLVYQQFKSALAEAGLEEVDATGKPFDPHLHEAVLQQETSEAPEDHVVQQLRKGYKLRERLLRPASVIVAKRPTA